MATTESDMTRMRYLAVRLARLHPEDGCSAAAGMKGGHIYGARTSYTPPAYAMREILEMDKRAGQGGGIIAVNNAIDVEQARLLLEHGRIAVRTPRLTRGAHKLLAKQTKVRVVTGPLETEAEATDSVALHWTTRTKLVGEAHVASSMALALEVANACGDDAVVLVLDVRTVGIGIGRGSPRANLELALARAKDHCVPWRAGMVMASTATLSPADETIKVCGINEVVGIVQPEGGEYEAGCIRMADTYRIAMGLTGSLQARP